MVVQAEATSAGANTVGIVEIRLLEDNHSLKFGSTGGSRVEDEGTKKKGKSS